MRALLARRDTRLLVLARLIDMAGSNALWIALGIRVKDPLAATPPPGSPSSPSSSVPWAHPWAAPWWTAHGGGPC